MEKSCRKARKLIDNFLLEKNWNSRKSERILQEIGDALKHPAHFSFPCRECTQYFTNKLKEAYDCKRARQDAQRMIEIIVRREEHKNYNPTAFDRFNKHAVKAGTGKGHDNPIIPQCPECWEYYMELKRKLGYGG